MKIVLIWMLALSISVGLGHIVTSFVTQKLRKQIKDAPPGKFTIYLGYLERFAFTVAWAIDMPVFIMGWLAIKMAGRWVANENRSNQNKDWQVGIINLFLIGNLISLIFAVTGGMIIKKWGRF